MVVSDSHKFIFLAIPKIGSSTLKTLLTEFGWKTPQSWDGSHMTPIQALRHPWMRIYMWDEYFKFCFVRNPWDRYVASFLFLETSHINSGSPLYNSFEGYINCGGYEGMHQYEFLLDHVNKYTMDFVGKFETFNASIKTLFNQLKLLEPTKIPNQNSHQYPGRKHYTEYYTEQWMIDTVAEREKLVIEKFGYKFGEDGDNWR